MTEGEEEEDYNESEDEEEEDNRLMREATISNQYHMSKFVLSPEAKGHATEINKDMVLGYLDNTELAQIRLYGDLISNLKELAKTFNDLERNVEIAVTQRDTVLVSSRAKDGFGTIMINKQILEHKKIQEITKNKNKEGLGGFGFFGKKRKSRGDLFGL